MHFFFYGVEILSFCVHDMCNYALNLCIQFVHDVCNYALFVSLLCAKWKFYRFAFNLYIHDVLVEFSAEECVR